MIAALSSWHEEHDRAAQVLEDVKVLPAHVVLEAYAVLTRLPSGLAVPAASAAQILSRRFTGEPLALDDTQRRAVLATLAGAGVFAGASYDGLVGLEAQAHGRVLITLDQRAQGTYQRLGVRFRAL